VLTKDGALVARHEEDIIETTNVADHPEFAARKVVKAIDGQRQEGWFTEDFYAAGIEDFARGVARALRPESMGFDGQFEIATLGEIAGAGGAQQDGQGQAGGLIPRSSIRPISPAGL